MTATSPKTSRAFNNQVVPEHPRRALANAAGRRVEVGRSTLGFVNAPLVTFPSQPEGEALEDNSDVFECRECSHMNNVGEMYCTLCGASNMPSYQSNEEKEVEKTTFAQLLEIRTENLIMKQATYSRRT